MGDRDFVYLKKTSSDIGTAVFTEKKVFGTFDLSD